MNYDEIEKQIGGLGDETPLSNETPSGNETPSLGKLEHDPFSQKALTEEEKRSLERFNSRTAQRNGDGLGGIDLRRNNDIAAGWIPIDRAEMGVRGAFYPEDWEFRVKPATVEAIKNWSSIDEENLAVTNNVFNEIMRMCVSIVSTNGNVSWNKINSWDRFWFILKVREYTFVNGENKLHYDEECDNCGEMLNYELVSSQLYYEFPDNDIVDKYWNANERRWVIDPKEYGLNERVVTLFTPTLEKDDAILQWAYTQQQNNKRLSEPFLRFLPWMLERAPKDPTLLDKHIKECKKTFDSWDIEMFNFMEDVLRNITINPSEKLTQVCPHCGEAVTTAVRFPNGIKHIFAMESRHKKFGSK